MVRTEYTNAKPLPTFTIAHLSDLHFTAPRLRGWRSLSPKRLAAGLAWSLGKSARHQAGILELALRDLDELAPDAVVVTGDLTQIGLPSEYEEARLWLERLSRSHEVAVVPGNHDATGSEAPDATIGRWAPWLSGVSAEDTRDTAARPDPAKGFFPFLRRVGDFSLIGLSSARPSPLLLATGTVGRPQLDRLRHLLWESGRAGSFRVVFLHHPPCIGSVSWRKRLTDARDLSAVLGEEGVELVLHGHAHRPMLAWLAAGASRIPVLGAPSITEVARKGPRYLVHRVERSGRAWKIETAFRGLSAAGDRFEEDPSPGLVLEAGSPVGTRVAADTPGWNR